MSNLKLTSGTQPYVWLRWRWLEKVDAPRWLVGRNCNLSCSEVGDERHEPHYFSHSVSSTAFQPVWHRSATLHLTSATRKLAKPSTITTQTITNLFSTNLAITSTDTIAVSPQYTHQYRQSSNVIIAMCVSTCAPPNTFCRRRIHSCIRAYAPSNLPIECQVWAKLFMLANVSG